MNKEINFTVNYKINAEGNCCECDCRSDVNDELCLPFNSEVKWYASSSYRQCKKCKDFLSKVNQDLTEMLKIPVPPPPPKRIISEDVCFSKKGKKEGGFK